MITTHKDPACIYTQAFLDGYLEAYQEATNDTISFILGRLIEEGYQNDAIQELLHIPHHVINTYRRHH